MTIQIYDNIRVNAAIAAFNWPANDYACVIPKLDYIFSAAHSNITIANPLRSQPSIITNRSVDAAGWLLSDPIIFASTPPNEDINQCLIYRLSDGLLAFRISFATIRSTDGKPIIIRRGLSQPGLCRL